MARKKVTRKSRYIKKTFTFQGKRIYVYGKTEEEAILNKIKKKEELERGLENFQNPTLDEYYERFTETRTHEVKGSTLYTQNGYFKCVSTIEVAESVPFGSLKMREITRRNVEDVRNKMIKTGRWTPRYINLVMTHLGQVFRAALRDDTVEKNPCETMKRLKETGTPIGENRHRALTVEETRKFFETAEKLDSVYINAYKFMLLTGVRVGELGALYPTDIDTKSGFIHIRRTVTKTEAGFAIGETPKTDSSVRDIPLTDEILEVVRDQKLLNDLCGWKSQRIFESSRGLLLTPITLRYDINKICEAAGMEPFSCHAFRNTFATRWIEQRPQDYKVLSEIMGHANIDITLNLYTHVMTESKIVAMNDVKILVS